jgi:hypothetical protein
MNCLQPLPTWNNFQSKMELMVVNPIGDINELEVPKTTLPFLQSDKEFSFQEQPHFLHIL